MGTPIILIFHTKAGDTLAIKKIYIKQGQAWTPLEIETTQEFPVYKLHQEVQKKF